MKTPTRLRTEGRVEPLGVGVATPEFAWALPPGVVQGSFQLEVATDPTFESGVVWRSGTVPDSRPFGVVYRGEPLASRARYWWRVRTYSDGLSAEWSAPSWFETGLLGEDALSARWISHTPAGSDDRRALYFRQTVRLSQPVVRARAYVSALGWYRLFVNGTDATGSALVPGWTPFDETVEYQVYDVTDAFHPGDNTIGIAVGDGRFRGALGFDLEDARYGNRLAVIAEIVVTFGDGSQELIGTDDAWQVGRGRIRSADPARGERVDLRIDEQAWLDPAQTLESETSAQLLPDHGRVLVAETAPPVREIGRRSATVTTTPSGRQLIDFGQNFSGVAAIHLRGPVGETVRLLYSEVLTPDGELDTDYLFPPGRGPSEWFQRDEVILGQQPTLYSPWFTIRGFRYVAVEGADALSPDDVHGIVMSSDIPQIAHFEASDERLQRLWSNAMWSLRSNFLDTPTDCPTRERSGWTGDIQVFGSTAVQLVEADTFLRRYLHNLAIEQYDDGRVPPYIPSERSRQLGPHPMEYVSTSVGWGDVSVLLPWTLYAYRGDERVLRDQYDSAKKWVDYLALKAEHVQGIHRWFAPRFGEHEKYILDSGFHWGEWLRPGDGNTWWRSRMSPPAVVATAYLAHSAGVLAQIAAVLGNTVDVTAYTELHAATKTAWQVAFVRQDGARIGDDKQDDYVRALAFDLLPPAQRGAAADRLVDLIEQAGTHLQTGFLSTPLLLAALVRAGRSAVAHDLLFQTSSPSWLAQVKQGATTIWEQWDGYDAHGKAHDSHNHYAFGSVVAFLHEHVAGLAPDAPGYRRIRFSPTFPVQLTSAGVDIDTPYGLAASRWERTSEGIRWHITVPGGSVGVVDVPGISGEYGPGHPHTRSRYARVQGVVRRDNVIAGDISRLPLRESRAGST